MTLWQSTLQVAKYTASGKDKSGHKTYRELQKPRLVNHYVFDPQKNEDREKYYYSLILLFVPFRDKSDLLLAGETAEGTEEAFNCLLPTNCRRIWLLRPPLRKSTKPGRLTLKTNNLNTRKTMTLRLKVKPKQQCRTLLTCMTIRKSTKPGRLTLKTNNLNTSKTMTLRLKVKPKQQCRTMLTCDNAAADTITLEERVDMLNADQTRL